MGITVAMLKAHCGPSRVAALDAKGFSWTNALALLQELLPLIEPFLAGAAPLMASRQGESHSTLSVEDLKSHCGPTTCAALDAKGFNWQNALNMLPEIMALIQAIWAGSPPPPPPPPPLA